MARFVFRLESVLAYRRRIENQRQRDLAVALGRLREAEKRRDDLIAGRTALRARLRDHHREMDAFQLRAAYAHCDYLDREITSQEGKVAAAGTAAEAERLKLVAATKDKKVLEILKSRRREAFDTAAAAAEQSLLDDINARIYDRAAQPSAGDPR